MGVSDYILHELKEFAKTSPSAFTHAAILVKNNKPIWSTMSYNVGHDHAEMRSCQRYKGLSGRREKG